MKIKPFFSKIQNKLKSLSQKVRGLNLKQKASPSPRRDWKQSLSQLSARFREGHFLERTREVGNKIDRLIPENLKRFARDSSQKTLQQLKKRSLSFYGKLATVLSCSYFAADLSALLVQEILPEPPRVRSSYRSPRAALGKGGVDQYSPVFSRNLFNHKGLIPGGQKEQKDPLEGPPVKTSLPLTLVGTMVLQDSNQSIATIEDKTASRVYPVMVEDEIPSKIRVLKIEAYRVIFVNLQSRRKEFVEMPKDLQSEPIYTSSRKTPGATGVKAVNSRQFVVNRNEIDKAMANFNKILTQARAVPHFENGKPAGYKIFQIEPGSIYSKLGIKNGDVISQVNGEDIKDPAKAFELFNELKLSSHMEITVKRNGKATTLVYDIQ